MGNFKISDRNYNCPVELTLNTIQGKWKILILWYLINGTKRYGELKKLIPKVTHKMLIQGLRELQEDGIIKRKVYPVIPPKVEYFLTKDGKGMIPFLREMRIWGLRYKTAESYEDIKVCEP